MTSPGWRVSLPTCFVFIAVCAGCQSGARDRFEAEVVPTLERRCLNAACHGVSETAPWPSTPGFFVRLDGRGRVRDVDAARDTALERVSVDVPRASSLVRIPLPLWAGGGPHAGGALFTGPDDDALVTMVEWISAEAEGGEDAELDALDVQFRDEVLPVLMQRCARGGCHGPADIAFTAFPAHVVSVGEDSSLGVVAPRDVHATRLAARRHLDLWGSDARNSRFIRKALGDSTRAGIAHRGGVATFFPEAPPDDPFASDALQAVLAWARAERAALGIHEGHEPRAVLFIEGPAAARAPYRIEAGELGSDLFIAGWPEPGTPQNLSAALHPEGPAEVRDAALSHDAERVAFAMRRADERSFAIYELELSSRAWRRVTLAGATGSFVQPVYASDGRIIAVWDGHGELGADGAGVAPELVALSESGELERLTFTPTPEVRPALLASGKTRGELVFGTRREGARGAEGVLFRFPLCHDPRLHGEPEYHVQVGASLAPAAPLIARDLPDGRQVMVVLDSALAGDDRGSLAVFDRAFGPDVGESIEGLSLGGYRRPLSTLDSAPRYRDPAPLPDGRILVSRDDESAPGADAIELLALVSDRAGTRLDARRTWLSRPGRSLRSATPVFPRPPEDDGHEPITDPRAEDGFLVLRDVAVLESLFGRAEPRGARPLREDIVSIRLLASARARADEVTYHPELGTTVGASTRIPARVLAEVSLPADRSAWLRVPARTPILFQFLDASGMEVGRSLDRWYFAEGGEVVPGGTNAESYAHDCAGCHGAASGHPSDATARRPDAISAASITLATFEARDRRRPLPPRELSGPGEEVDFVTTIAPLVRTRCVEGCHAGALPDAGLSLEAGPDPVTSDRRGFDAPYRRLLPFVDLTTLRARRSPLMERVTGRELDAPGAALASCVPEGPDLELTRIFARWIEAGAFHDLHARERP